jgi:hypothetical protein
MTSLFYIRKQKQIACKQKLIKERDVIPKVPTAAELHPDQPYMPSGDKYVYQLIRF